MSRRALLVDIDRYENVLSLTGCVADATRMAGLLQRNEDGSRNFDCRLLTSDGPDRITRTRLRQEWQQLFHNFTGDILFYFSGHGSPTEIGAYLVVQDGTLDDPGISMNDLLLLANRSRAREVTLILDCCFSGNIGDPAFFQVGSVVNQSQLREGVTILAASGANEYSKELNGHGVFTSLVLDALEGGASDTRGEVSAASVYAYVERALGSWDQRPVYKSYAGALSPLRRCRSHVPDEVLREICVLFNEPDSKYRMDPSYEITSENKNKKNVELFRKFKMCRDAHLLRTLGGEDLYYTAMKSNCVELTHLGKFYWHLGKQGRF
jgi:hypothetical protein